MPLPSFRNSRSKVRRRRAHHALSQVGSVVCTQCGSPVLPHRACASCGFYKGRDVRGGSVAKAARVIEKATAPKKAKAEAPAKEKPAKAPVKRAPRKTAAKKTASAE